MMKEQNKFEPKGIIYKAIHKRAFTIFFTIVVILFGCYSYYFVPKQESPDVTPPIAIISTIYPGASPEDVEKLVTQRIEDVVLELESYKESNSYSRNSISVVVLELENKADVEKSWQELRRKLDDIQGDLPEECFATEVDTNLSETAGMLICLAGEDYSYEQLASIATDLKKDLVRIPGVSRFDIKGEQKKEIGVKVRIGELNQYDVSLDDIVMALKIQNLEIPSGAIDTGEMQINVRTPSIFTAITDIENTIITVSRETGALVRLKDIADIDWEMEEAAYKIKHNGQNAIILAGYFQNDKNIVLIGKDVREVLDEKIATTPQGVEVSEITFQPEEVSSSVNGFFLNLLGGMVLVLIVVFVGMGLRNALVASVAVPLSILIAFIAMFLTGIKIHEISIASLIIALGILVDNAIVVIDAIQDKIDQGIEKLEACITGTKESILPIFAATLVTTVAFAPILMVPGAAGDYMRSIPYMLGFSLFASFAVAVLVTPVMAYIFYDKFPAKAEEKASKIRDRFEKYLEKALYHKKKALALILGVFVLSCSLLNFIPLQFFPLADQDMVYLDLHAEKKGDIGKTEALAAQAEEFLAEQPEVTSITTAIGNGLPKFYLTIPQATPSSDYAQIMFKVDLDKSERFKGLQELAVHFQQEFDTRLVEGKATMQLLQKAYPGAPLEIRILGEDRDRVKQLAGVFTKVLHEMPATINIENDADEASYEFMVDVDNDRATQMGITKYDIGRQINIALMGSEASMFRKAGKEFAIRVKSDLRTKEELENLEIKSSITGSKVLLKQFAQVKLDAVYPSIKKYNGSPCITVTSYLKPGNSAVTMEGALRKEVDLQIQQEGIDLKGIDILYQGEAKDIADNFSDLAIGAIFGIFGIYLILMLQFGSFKQPFIIFTTIPLSMIGVFVGLFVFRQPLSFTALVGAVALFGLVIKNGILLIEYMNKAVEEGETVEKACLGALKRRYRPIILSSVTTVFGLIPLVLSRSALFMPMSVALMSGLLVSTLLTLIFIPLLYAIIGQKKQTSTSRHIINQATSSISKHQ